MHDNITKEDESPRGQTEIFEFIGAKYGVTLVSTS